MRALAPALLLALLSCTQSFPLPPGAQLSCGPGDDCPVPLLCDPELSRCVDAIIPAPKLELRVDRTEGTRATDFTFTATSPDSALRYRWELLDDRTGDAGVLVDDGSPTLVHRFTLGSTEFCPPGQPCNSALARTVRVIATNEGGKKAERQASVVIKNGAPIADFGEDLFVSELGVPEVELDPCGGVRLDGGCTARDPDGDALSFSGFSGDAGIVLRDAGQGRVRFTLPPNWERPLIFTGAVTDGIESASATVRVFRGSHLWVNTGLLDQTWRIHPDFRATTGWASGDGGATFHSPEALVSDGVGGWWFGDSDDTMAGTGPTLVVHLDRHLNELERWEEPNNSDDFVDAVPSLVPPRGAVPGCLAYRHFTATVPDDQSGFVRFTTGPSQTTLKHSRPRTNTGAVRLPLAVLPVGSSADCWAIGNGPEGTPGFNSIGGELGKLRPDGTWEPVATLAGYPHAWAAEADGTLWIAERFPIPSADGGFSPPFLNRYRTELRRFSPAGVSSTVEVGGHFLVGLAAHPRGGVWAVRGASRSLLRVWPDGTTTEASTPPVGSPGVFVPPGIAVDPVSASVWITDALADQLYRFDELADGGLTVGGLVRVEDLPPGTNRKGFLGRVAVDPSTGTATSFVGAAGNLYARWVTIPMHARRLERSGVHTLEASRPRGDPTSGHLWSVEGAMLRRLDAKGRVLVETPNAWADMFPGLAPLIVDRRGRAWVVTTDGVPALRMIDSDGNEAPRLPLPFNPTSLALASSMQGGAPREVACGVSRLGEVMKLELSAPAPQRLSVPPQADGGVITPYACAPMSNGRLWVLANQYAGPHLALVYEPGATTAGPPRVVRVRQPGEDGVQVTGAAADEATGDLYFTTWVFPDYSSELWRVDLGGNVSLVRTLQGAGAAGIGLSVQPRRTCQGFTPRCLELWVNNRLSEVHKYDPQGTDLETFVFGRVEPALDLVQ